MECAHLLADGLCNGRYRGFACIGPRCKADKGPACEHYDRGFYCMKFHRFGCIGPSKCQGLSDSMTVPHEQGEEPFRALVWYS